MKYKWPFDLFVCKHTTCDRLMDSWVYSSLG